MIEAGYTEEELREKGLDVETHLLDEEGEEIEDPSNN